jgi:hypothetical protein
MHTYMSTHRKYVVQVVLATRLQAAFVTHIYTSQTMSLEVNNSQNFHQTSELILYGKLILLKPWAGSAVSQSKGSAPPSRGPRSAPWVPGEVAVPNNGQVPGSRRHLRRIQSKPENQCFLQSPRIVKTQVESAVKFRPIWQL